LAIAKYSDLSLRDTIIRLRDAGLDSIPVAALKFWTTTSASGIARLKCNTEDGSASIAWPINSACAPLPP